MADDKRRAAADARRITEQGDRQAAGEIRKLLKRNYERGVVAGREQAEAENASQNARATLLLSSADTLEAAMSRTSKIPNSNRAMGAFREAISILRDAAGGEPPSSTEPDKETKKAQAEEAKTASSKVKSKAKSG